MIDTSDLLVGKLYQVEDRWFPMFDNATAARRRIADISNTELFVLLEVGPEYWIKILSSTGSVGWVYIWNGRLRQTS